MLSFQFGKGNKSSLQEPKSNSQKKDVQNAKLLRFTEEIKEVDSTLYVPRVLYHGTLKKDVQSIIHGIKISKNEIQVEGKGFYTTTSRDMALVWAMHKDDGVLERLKGENLVKHILKTFSIVEIIPKEANSVRYLKGFGEGVGVDSIIIQGNDDDINQYTSRREMDPKEFEEVVRNHHNMREKEQQPTISKQKEEQKVYSNQFLSRNEREKQTFEKVNNQKQNPAETQGLEVTGNNIWQKNQQKELTVGSHAQKETDKKKNLTLMGVQKYKG